MKKRMWLISFLSIFFLVAILIFSFSKKQLVEKEETTPEKVVPYDVVVIGGDPEGVAAAVASARSGAKTLLVDKRESLGGLLTHGMLNYLDIGLDHEKKPTSEGIFKEWHTLVGGQAAFNIENGTKAFHALVENEKNLDLWLHTTVESVSMKNENTIASLTLQTAKEKKNVTAKRFIDATVDGDVATLAGAKSFHGQEDIGVEEAMGVTLVMHFQQVDWAKVKEVAKSGRFGSSVALEKTAWGFWGIVDEYQTKFERTRMRGLNIAHLGDDVYINALQIFEVNGLDHASKKEAIEIGKEETEHFLTWAKENFPGFEEATIATPPTELYVRETRHMDSLYQLSLRDVWENRAQEDTIAVGGYPVDVQATKPNGKDYVLVDADKYEIPFRSLVPKSLHNVLVASRAAGFSSLAAGSARIVPTGMSLGEAAGTAASLSIIHNQDFHEFAKNKGSIATLQEQLLAQGARIYGSSEAFLYQDHPHYEALAFLYSYGLIFAGYENDLHLTENISVTEAVELIEKAASRIQGKRMTLSSLALEGENLTDEKMKKITKFLSKKEIDVAQFSKNEAKNERVTKEEFYVWLAKSLQ